MFNKANKGKVTIIQDGDIVHLIKGPVKPWLLKKDKNNPDFPLKNYVLCPMCRKPLYGSAPRSKSGKHIPTYHCARNHKYWGVNKDDFDKTIEPFVKNVRFTEEFKRDFREAAMKIPELKREEAIDANINLSEQIAAIEKEQKAISITLRQLSSPVAIRQLEADIDDLEQKRLKLLANKDEKEKEKSDTQSFINFCYYFMEHFEELVLNQVNPLIGGAFIGCIFAELPTYDEIKFGTPKLARIFELNEEYKATKSLSVSRRGVEPRTDSLRGNCSAS